MMSKHVVTVLWQRPCGQIKARVKGTKAGAGAGAGVVRFRIRDIQRRRTHPPRKA